jgi:iron complex transport system substrate-binding protein
VSLVALVFVATLIATVATQTPAPAQRIITVIPAVTEILFALGAGPQVVGVGSFDELPDGAPEIARVGGLLDPDMERIFTLRPDLVILYASQADPRAQLERAGIAVLPYTHAGLADIGDTIRALGERTGRTREGTRLADDLEKGLEVLRMRLVGRERPRTLLVFSREPHGLRNIYASGGIGFLHDILEVAGGENVFKDVRSERVAQVSSEAILSDAPEAIVELRNTGMFDDDSLDTARAVWQRLATVPAVRSNRVYFLTGNEFVVPGPRVLEAGDARGRQGAKSEHIGGNCD